MNDPAKEAKRDESIHDAAVADITGRPSSGVDKDRRPLLSTTRTNQNNPVLFPYLDNAGKANLDGIPK